MTAARNIDVVQADGGDPLVFNVAIREGRSETRHRVTMTAAHFEKLTGGAHTPEECIDAAFRFLLDREPKESILGSFDVTVISRYFPAFEREIADYLDI